MVISIIGLLSSIILAALAVARDQGRVAAVVQFADHNYHKLASDVLLSMNFDEANSLASPVDQTYNFSTSTTAINHSSNTPFTTGYSFDMTNTSGMSATVMSVSTPSGSSVPISDTSGLTVSIWFNRLGVQKGNDYLLSGSGVLRDVNGTAYSLQVTAGYVLTYATSLSCQIAGSGLYVFYTLPAVDSKWHNVTCSYDAAKAITSLYYDDQMVAQQVPGSVNPINHIFFLVSSPWNLCFFKWTDICWWN